jgi:tetratricopeptide (TPR) repeat protein
VWSSALLYLSVVASLIGIFFGFLYYVERLRKHWPLWKQGAAALLGLVILVAIPVVIFRDKVLVDESDLITLREIADAANKTGDYDAAVKLTTWAVQFKPDDEELYRTRARAYKHKGPQFYPDEIADRQLVLRLNPTRELNHLPIVEDYILLKKYESARKWIGDYRNSIKSHDERMMFDFFEIVCDVLEARNSTTRADEFTTSVRNRPLSKKFVNNTWEWNYLDSFLDQNPFPATSKQTIKDLVIFLKSTAT